MPDFLISDKVILEIKSSTITTERDVAQQRSYLKSSKYEVGYLVNFGSDNMDIRRSIYTNDRKHFIPKLDNFIN